jgi:hypothetical protein
LCSRRDGVLAQVLEARPFDTLRAGSRAPRFGEGRRELSVGAGFCGVFRLLGETDTERLQEAQIVTGEGTFCGFVDGVRGLCWVLCHFIQADGGFKHEENVETLFTDVFDDSCDVLRLGDGLVDRFTKLLDQVLDLLIQCHLRVALWIETVFPSSVESASDYARIGYSRKYCGNGIAAPLSCWVFWDRIRQGGPGCNGIVRIGWSGLEVYG